MLRSLPLKIPTRRTSGDSLRRLLSKQPFLKGLGKNLIDEIIPCASLRRFRSGSLLFHEEDKANQFLIIIQGNVALELCPKRQEGVVLQTLGEHEVVGWSWLFAPYRWQFGARAVKETQVIILNGECLRRTCEKNQDLGFELLKRFSLVLEDRVRAMHMQLVQQYSE